MPIALTRAPRFLPPGALALAWLRISSVFRFAAQIWLARVWRNDHHRGRL